MDTFGIPQLLFYKNDNFCDFLIAFLHTKLFWKDIFSKRKEFPHNGSELFPFHYENTPIQICRKFHHQTLKIFR